MFFKGFLPAAKPSGLWIANVKLELLPAGEVETLVHLRAPPPPNLAGEVETLVYLSAPPPPNLAGEVVTLVHY